MKSSHDHVHDHNADKACDADMMNYIASLMKGKGKGYFGKRHGPMDVDEGKNMKCYHCGEFGHRKSQCPVLDRIMNEWRSKGPPRPRQGQRKGSQRQGQGSVSPKRQSECRSLMAG